MASFNKVILLGNLTRDPELRVPASTGNAICKLGLAVNRRYNTRDGEQREETTFVDIDAFGRQAETLAKYCRKGSGLLVEGRLRLDQWETQQGEKRSKLNVVLENFQFVGRGDSSSGGDSSGDGGGSRGGYENQSPPAREGNTGGGKANASDDLEDDVPF